VRATARGKAATAVDTVRVRHSELWARMERHLGGPYSRVWARQQVLRELGGRTVEQALAEGEPPKRVWRAVCSALELPDAER